MPVSTKKRSRKKSVPENSVPVNSEIVPVKTIEYLPYLDTVQSYINAGWKRILLIGGTRSGKTYQIAILILRIALNPQGELCEAYLKKMGPRKGVFIVIARQKLTDFKTTVWKDMKEILMNMGIFPADGTENAFIKINRVDHCVTFKHNGSEIWLTGSDRASKGMGAAPDICWFNEISEISEEFYEQVQMRKKMFTVFDCNPKMSKSHWAQTKLLKGEGISCYVHRSTWRDNFFLDRDQVNQIKGYEPTKANIEAGTADEYRWKVYGLGVFAVKEGLVFTEEKDWDIVEDKEFPSECSWCWALDVGFRDKMAFGRVAIKDGCIYVDELCYESELSVATPVDAPGKDSLIKRFAEYGVKRGDLIVYDAASPTAGDSLVASGYNAVPCRKEGGGRASIVPQISEMLRYHIRVTRRSVGWISEAMEYSWNAKDPDGNPVGLSGDHSIDMSRYGATYLMMAGGLMRHTRAGRSDFFRSRQKFGCVDKTF